jgi:dUTPase
MILLPFVEMSFNEVNELSDTVRGESGFGDSGKF